MRASTTEEISCSHSISTELVYCNLPVWIRNSVLCQTQVENNRQNPSDDNEDDQDLSGLTVYCLEEYSNFNLNIQSLCDIERLLRIIQYWNVHMCDTPFEIFDYIFRTQSNALTDIESKNNDHLCIREYSQLPVIHVYKSIIECAFPNGNLAELTDIEFSCNLLEYAVESNNFHLIQYVIEYKKMSLRNDITFECGKKLTMIASKLGFIDILAYLRQNACPWSASCIRWAIKNKRKDCLEYLQLHECPWNNSTDSDEMEFLKVTASWSTCVEKSQLDVLTFILDTTSININLVDINGRAALHRAVLHNRLNVVKLLLDYGADVNNKTKSGLTALYTASCVGCLPIVQLLLQYDADSNIKTISSGYTALFAAAENGHYAVVDLLLTYGTDVNMRSHSGHTILYWAARNGYCSLLRLLLVHGANVNVKTPFGESPLYVAAGDGSYEIVNTLLCHNADVNILTNNGCSSLYFAVYKGHYRIVELLLRFNADMNLKNFNGYSALYRAVSLKQNKILFLLIESGADINIQTTKGETALFAAAHVGNTDAVKLLLENGCNFNTINSSGRSVLDVARINCNQTIVKLLECYLTVS